MEGLPRDGDHRMSHDTGRAGWHAAEQGVEADEAERIGASQLNSSVLRTVAGVD
jgi:hypothetical protein